MGGTTNKLSRICNRMAGPVAKNPVFIAIMTILGGLPPFLALHIRQFIPELILLGGLEGFLTGYIVAFLADLIPEKIARWVKGIVAAGMTFLVFIEGMHLMLIKSVFNPASVTLMANTNSHEVRGFFHQFFTPAAWIAAIIGLGLVITAGCIAGSSRKRISGRLTAIGICSIIFLSAAILLIADKLTVIGVSNTEELIRWDNTGPDKASLSRYERTMYSPSFPKILYLKKAYDLDSRIINEWLSLQPEFYKTPAGSDADSTLNIVVIIGESFIKSHSSLYGYHLDTNPMLRLERDSGNLVVFTDMIAPANYTTICLRNIFNLNTHNPAGRLKETWNASPYFPMLFRRAGWDVDFYTNQYSPYDGQDLSNMMFSDFLLKNVYRHHSDSVYPYDKPYLEHIPERENINKGRPLLTFHHLLGQHFPPDWFYPHEPENEIFNIDDIPSDKDWLDDGKRKMVAYYANATRYNDRVVRGIIDRYRDREAVIVYFSDHGEEMYDSAPFGNRNAQHPEDAGWMHRQFDIPFMVWMSDTYISRNPEMVKLIRESASKPGETTDLGQMLLFLGKIDTPYYDAAVNILSHSYRPAMPRVNALGYQYPE